MAALFGGAVGGDGHAGGIEGIGGAGETNLGGGGAGLGVLREHVKERLEPEGVGGGVVVDDGDEIGGVRPGGEVDGGAVAEIGAGVEGGDSGIGEIGWPGIVHAVFPAIVDDHDGEIAAGLVLEATDAFP